MARAVDDKWIIVPLVDGKMDDGTPQRYEFVILRTEFDLKNYWKLSTISRLEQCERLEFYLKRNADASGSKDLRLSHQERQN
jgi:CRP/FNR family transcriptional regulator